MALRADKEWPRAVYVSLAKIGHGKMVDNTKTALNMLLGAWPVDAGHHFNNALVICQSVLHNALQPEHAMEAFLRAAKEAGVTVGDVPQYLSDPNDPSVAFIR